MEQFSRAHSPPPEEDDYYQSGGENRYAIKLANALKVRLQYARLKVSSGMANKNLQEVEEAMIPRPLTPTRKEEETGEQEEAAARTIMMLSSSRDKVPLGYYNNNNNNNNNNNSSSPMAMPIYNHPPSLFDVVAQDRLYYQKSQEIGKQLPRLSHDNKLRHIKQQQQQQQRKKSRDHHRYGKDHFQSTKPYTAPRRGRPKKISTTSTS